MIETNVKNLISEIPESNAFGEKITLVAAVKLQPPENINRAIAAGITDIDACGGASCGKLRGKIFSVDRVV